MDGEACSRSLERTFASSLRRFCGACENSTRSCLQHCWPQWELMAWPSDYMLTDSFTYIIYWFMVTGINRMIDRKRVRHGAQVSWSKNYWKLTAIRKVPLRDLGDAFDLRAKVSIIPIVYFKTIWPLALSSEAFRSLPLTAPSGTMPLVARKLPPPSPPMRRLYSQISSIQIIWTCKSLIDCRNQRPIRRKSILKRTRSWEHKPWQQNYENWVSSEMCFPEAQNHRSSSGQKHP